jgi:transposase InsO family protein
MALRVRTIVEQKLSAMKLVEAGVPVSEIAERFGVSRQSIYDWQARYREDPVGGLEQRSRRPLSSPTRTPEWIEQRLIEERLKWRFGAKKILRRLQDQEPEVAWPPRSTIDSIFKRRGLVRAHKKSRRRFAPVAARQGFGGATAGEVMTADFKGEFRLLNGLYCYPFTVADPVSRYLLACDAFARISLEQTWASLTRIFREYGMPTALHSDNGIPFGTSGHGRFSTLSVRLMKYGIQPTYNRPGHPQDNGRHERMHKTMVDRVTVFPAVDHAAQQVLFDEFRQMFNHERPHESLGQDRPAHHHRAASRMFPSNEPRIEYEPHFETQLVDPRGRIYWRGERIFFSEAFSNERIAFERVDYESWRVHYASFVIGRFGDAPTPLV